MAEPIPIACSLDADSYAARLAAVREVGEIALLRTRLHVDGSGTDLFFREGDEIHRRLREIVRAESTCCAFLDMELDVEEGVLRLTISGPVEAAPVVYDLVRSFGAGRKTR